MKRAINTILDKVPFIRPIIVLLKHLLRSNGLNDSFTGGMGSFLVFNIVYAYYQYLHNSELIKHDFNLGSFFTGLLHFYSVIFNDEELGISLRNGGYFFKKRDNTKLKYNSNLMIENFLDETKDVGKNISNYKRIKEYFKSLYEKITNKPDEESLIALIIK